MIGCTHPVVLHEGDPRGDRRGALDPGSGDDSVADRGVRIGEKTIAPGTNHRQMDAAADPRVLLVEVAAVGRPA